MFFIQCTPNTETTEELIFKMGASLFTLTSVFVSKKQHELQQHIFIPIDPTPWQNAFFDITIIRRCKLCRWTFATLLWTGDPLPPNPGGVILAYDIPLIGLEMEISMTGIPELKCEPYPKQYWENYGKRLLQERVDIVLALCPCSNVVELIISFIATHEREMNYAMQW